MALLKVVQYHIDMYHILGFDNEDMGATKIAMTGDLRRRSSDVQSVVDPCLCTNASEMRAGWEGREAKMWQDQS